MAKSANPATNTVGDTFKWTVAIENIGGAGNRTVYPVTFTENFPPGMALATSPTPYAVQTSGGQTQCALASWSSTGGAGGTATFTFTYDGNNYKMTNNGTCELGFWVTTTSAAAGTNILNDDASLAYDVSSEPSQVTSMLHPNITATPNVHGPVTVNTPTVSPTTTRSPTRTNTPTRTPTPGPINITKSASPSSVTQGALVTFTIRATANSSTTAWPYSVVDTLPTGWTWNGVTPTRTSGTGYDCTISSASQTGDVLTILLDNSDDQDPSEVCEIIFSAYANTAGTGQLNAQVDYSWSTTQGGGATTTSALNQAPVDVTAVPYTVTKSASPSTITGQTKTTYTVAIANTGGANLDLGTIVDTLPVGFSYVAGSATFNAVAIADPTLAGGGSAAQTLSFALTGTAIGSGLTRNLAYSVAIASTSTGAKTNSVSVPATMSSVSYTKTATATVTITTLPQRLWGTTLVTFAGSGAPTIDDASPGSDSAFDNDYTTSNSSDWANDGTSQDDSFVWTVVGNTTFATSITSAVALLRFAVDANYDNDKFEFQICVTSTCTQSENYNTYTNWVKVRSFGSGMDQMPPEGAPTGSLDTIAVDVSATVNTVAKANFAQFRVIGYGSTGGGDSFIIYLDEVALVVSGT